MIGWQRDARGRLVLVNGADQVIAVYMPPGQGVDTSGLPAGVLQAEPPPAVVAAFASGDGAALAAALDASSTVLSNFAGSPAGAASPPGDSAAGISASTTASAGEAEKVGMMPLPSTLEAWNNAVESLIDVSDALIKSDMREKSLRDAWQSSGLGDPPADVFGPLAPQPIPEIGKSVSEISELLANDAGYLNAFRRSGFDQPAKIELQRRARALDAVEMELKRRGAAVASFKDFTKANAAATTLEQHRGRLSEKGKMALGEAGAARDEWLAANRPKEWEATLARRSREGLRTGTMQPYQTMNLSPEEQQAATSGRQPAAPPPPPGGAAAPTPPSPLVSPLAGPSRQPQQDTEQMVARALGIELPMMARGGQVRLPRYELGAEIGEQYGGYSPSNTAEPTVLQPIAPVSGGPDIFSPQDAALAAQQAQRAAQRESMGAGTIGPSQEAVEQTTRIRTLRQQVEAEWYQFQQRLKQQEALFQQQQAAKLQQEEAQLQQMRAEQQQQEQLALAQIAQQEQVNMAELERQRQAVEQRGQAIEAQFASRMAVVQQALENARIDRDAQAGENPFTVQYLPQEPGAFGGIPTRAPARAGLLAPPPGVGVAA